jgi:hypothetical protein
MIRLDFETFDIQGPTLTTEADAAAVACLDSFVVKVNYKINKNECHACRICACQRSD